MALAVHTVPPLPGLDPIWRITARASEGLSAADITLRAADIEEAADVLREALHAVERALYSREDEGERWRNG